MGDLIKLLSLNVSIFDENNEKLAPFLAEQNADILCLQEITRKVDVTASDKFITKEPVDNATSQLTYSFFAPNWLLKDFHQKGFHGKELFEVDFGGFIEFGNYIKSKFPISRGESIFVQQHFSYMVDWEWVANHPGEESRAVQYADIDLGNTKKMRIINYHGIWSKDKQGTERTKTACQKIVNLAKSVTHPCIICGDFNLFPHTESMKVFDDYFINLVDTYNITHTRPKSNELSTVERNVVDYIFVSKDIEVKNFEAIDTDVSDHFPLVVEFEIR